MPFLLIPVDAFDSIPFISLRIDAFDSNALSPALPSCPDSFPSFVDLIPIQDLVPGFISNLVADIPHGKTVGFNACVSGAPCGATRAPHGA